MKIQNKLKPFVYMAGLAAPFAAYGETSLEEVVVTAERREQNLQEVPVAVSAFSSDFIQESRLQTFEDLTLKVPSLNFSSPNKTVAAPAMRGASTTILSPGVDQSVGIFIDEVYQGTFSDFDPDLFGLERIEILRGPQGTLYGRNVTGGAINIITSKPSDKPEANLDISLGNYDSIEFSARASGPLSDTLFGSISASSKRRDGTSDNRTTGDDIDSLDKDGFRGRLVWQPSDTVEFDLSGELLRDNSSVEARDFLGPVPTVQAFVDAGFAPDKDPDTVDITPENTGDIDVETQSLSLRALFQFDSFDLVSVTAYRSHDSFSPFSSILGTPLPTVGFQFDIESDQFTQEFRLVSNSDGPLSWVTGLFYLDSDGHLADTQDATLYPDTEFHDLFVEFGDGAFVPGVPIRLLSENLTEIETESISVFAQFTYEITDRLRLTLGSRYTDEEKSADMTVTELEGGEVPNFLFAPAGSFSVSGDEDYSAFTPRVTLDFDISDSTLVYATYSEGFKAGGFLLNPDTPEGSSVGFDPEYAENYEIGLKSRWWDDRLQVNAAVFHVDYEDQQIQTTLPDLTTIIDNAGSSEVDGVELEIQAQLAPSFNVWLSYTYMDGDLDEFADFESDMPFTPENSVSAGFAYEHLFGNGGLFRLQGDYQYKDDYLLEPRPSGADSQFTSGFDEQVNASMSYTFPSENWTIGVWGKNLTDERYITYGQDQVSFTYSTAEVGSGVQASQPRYNQPRTYGVFLRWNYF